MFKKIKEEFFTIFGFSVLIFMFGFIGYKLWYDNYLTMFIHMMIFIIFIVHYLCTMGNQSIFYSYFQSWEWKACWEDNDIKRIAGDHQSIIKSGLLTSVVTIAGLGILLYFLYKYHLLNWYDFSNVIWFRADTLSEYVVLNLYWYFLLGFGVMFLGMIIYFLIYPKYPSYKFDTAPLDKDLLNNYRKVSIRDTFILSIFIGIVVSYTLLNISPLLASHDPDSSGRGNPITLLLVSIISIFLHSSKARIYWLNWLGILYIIGLGGYIWLVVTAVNYNSNNLYLTIEVLTKILMWVIPSAIIGTIMLILFCIGIVIVNMLKSKKNTESSIYDELNQKMKPWLGFNSRFVSESFINEEYYDFKELYEKTHPKKKNLFYIEYFFSNILNRNVVSLLEHKKLLWLKVLFNWADALNSKSMVEVDWFEESSKRRKAIIETMPTRNRANFEDPEGDVFTNLEIEEVTNTKPSILLPFYVTGVIYLNVIPYFLIYNVVMLIIFTKFVDVISQMDIALFNILAYGYIGVMILIFMGFLLSIFMNSMAVWMAWKKYYRLQNEGNTDALFFSIFKQRAIYQNINDYSKDENGNTITNNYSRGLYPQFDIEKLDEITQKLSPKYYDLYSKKFPLSMEK